MKRVSRREWLRRATAASACAALGARTSRSADEQAPPARGDSSSPTTWKTALGLNGFASATRKYKKSFPIWEVLDFAERTGFDGVELVERWPQGTYPATKEKDRVLALRRLYDRFGLKIFSIQTGAAAAFDPSPNARRGWISRMRERVALVKALGGDCIGIWPYGPLRGQSIDQAISHLAGSLGEVARIASDEGIIAAFEIEPPFAFNTEKHLRQILEQADEEKLKTIYDPSHFDLMSGSSGKPHEMLQRIGVENIGYVHFTDTDGTLRDGGTSKHLAAGDGHLDIAASFRTLHDGGFRGWVMIDGWEVPDPYDAGRKGHAAIRQFLRKS